ncbi:MAG: RNA-guided pseudouridylation complex pseudouridine synthase subunit Cbf5 [Candidatus Aenigmarchaeota archaeon]|nr:RNA-guided pseudouridylation complex pseudouridine synthase subunit Cbf5 [Candidatus Aenigmarchaeota archaeon]
MGWLIKKHEASLTPFGCYPGARSLEEHIKNGIIILDKPPGPTSHNVDKWIKDILEVKKCSHGGTLDPRVSGVLVIALENATKLMPILLSSKKEYIGIINLHEEVEKKKIEKAFKSFIGKIKQIPPKKSAVARKEREREVYYLELLELKERKILFKIGCEAGFYVRRFADDLGKELGTGAHLQELRRTKSGNFFEGSAITLQDLVDAKEENRLKEVVLPMELVAENIGKIIVSDNAIDNICNGAPLAIGGIVRFEDNIKKRQWVALFSLKGELIAIGKALMNSEMILNKKRDLAVKTDRVLMKKGTYPK